MPKSIYNINKLKVSFTHLFLFVVIVIFAQTGLSAQSISDYPRINTAYQNILKLKLEPSRTSLKHLSDELKINPHYYYANNIADVLELLVTQDRNLYKKYAAHEDENIKGLKYCKDSNPYKLFYEADIRLQWALFKVLFEDDMKAAFSIRTAYNTIQKNIKEFPDFTPNYKTLGLLHILLSTLPDNANWLFNVFGMKGDLQLGLSEINRIDNKSPYHLETLLITILAQINILNKEKESLESLELLLADNADNLILNYMHSNTLIKYAQSEKALPRLSKLQYHSKEYLYLDNINYKLGEIHLQKQDYRNARNYYALFLNSYRGEDLIKDAWFKIFLTYWLSGDETMAEIHFKKAKNTGRSFADADKNAKSLLEQDNYPNKKLMQLRLATDGGYYQIASDISKLLSENNFESKKDKTEYYYRLARLQHKSGSQDDAIFNYLNTIKKAGKENWYFAPNACLQTGYLYLQKKDKVKAKFYFEKTLSYKKHKYKSGIDRKAKAAIDGL